MGTTGSAGAGATGASTGAAGATETVTAPGADFVAAGSGEGAVVTAAAGVTESVGVGVALPVVTVDVGVVSAFAVATKPKVRPPTTSTAAPPPNAAKAIFFSMSTAYPPTPRIKTFSSNEFTKQHVTPTARPDANRLMKEPHAMSNQDVNLHEVMPADEQAAIGRAAILGHFEVVWAELQATITRLKETPELVTREHVILYKDAIRHLMEWLRANGIEAYAHVSEAKGIDVQPGDRL